MTLELQLPTLHQYARDIFKTGVAAVDPQNAILNYCKLDHEILTIGDHHYNLNQLENIYIIGAGKASARMALAIETIIGDRIHSGIVVVKYDHSAPCTKITVMESAHPIPDENGVAGSIAISKLLKKTTAQDLVICLISGGGSALLPLPIDGITLKDKQNASNILLSCGASIHEINTIRKHLSLTKGGRLAQNAFPATLISLILSDVVGDDLDVIASGPTVPDTSTFADCIDIIDKYNIENKIPPRVMQVLNSGMIGKTSETPKPDDPLFKKTAYKIIGNNFEAIAAAEKKALTLGFNTLILSSMLEGDTTEASKFHLAIAKEVLNSGHPIAPPACILSGGETTVRIKGDGKGGRNQEFVLVAATGLPSEKKVLVLSGGTDGTDGPTDAAGAIADSTTLKRAQDLGLDPIIYLKNNDSYHFFKQLNDLLITGPTQTNVMDLRLILIA